MTPRQTLLILIPVLLCAVIISGCTSSTSPGTASSQAAGFPMTLTDDLGHTMTFSSPPQRIVSLAPSNTEILSSLGLGDRVTGVDYYSNYPEEARTKQTMGGMTNVSEDRVISLKPDIVLVGQFTPARTINNLTAAGIKTFSTHPDNITDTYRTIQMFGNLFGVPDRAQQLVSRLKAEVAAIANMTSGLNDSAKPTVLMIITPGNQSYVADKDGYMGDLITLGGGRNVATGPTMTPGEIISANPDIIIVPMTDWTIDTYNSLVNGREPWMRNLTAVKNGKVYTVNYDVVGRPGPGLSQAAMSMVRTIHPELFAKPAARSAAVP